MTWSLVLAAVISVSGLSAPAASDRPPAWHVSVRVASPLTTTDPQHVGVGIGVAHAGTYRMAVQYQPTDEGRLGMIHAALGRRVLKREAWQLSLDMEHTQVRSSRRLFRGTGWQLDGHDRRQLSFGTASVQWPARRFLGLIDAVEAGVGRLHLWRLVSARADGAQLGESRDPILESAAPVGMVGIHVLRPLFWGLVGQARVRLIGAGRSRGGEVPFAHVTAEWDVTHQLFRSHGFGRGVIGVSGNHATNTRAASYFQNALGLTLRIGF